MNIALITSKGGHLGQTKLIFTERVLEKHNAILVTETESPDRRTKEKSFLNKFKTYYFKKDNLRFNPFKYFSALLRLRKILQKEKISCIVTNGAQISIPAVMAAKSLGIKTIFIDTVIRVKSPNWSARASYFFSDYFFVQHKHMAKKYGRRAKYFGSVI